MTAAKMPKNATGLFLRKGSNAWQWGIVVPADLASRYDAEKWAWRGSLKTTDRREAELLAAGKRLEWLTKFEQQRSAAAELVPKALEAITPELRGLIAETLRHDMLAVDEDVRTNSKKHAWAGSF